MQRWLPLPTGGVAVVIVVVVGDLAGIVRPEVPGGMLTHFCGVILVLSDFRVFGGVLDVPVNQHALSVPPGGPAYWW